MHVARPVLDWLVLSGCLGLPAPQVAELSAALEEERKLGRAKDARHKLTVERLRRHNLQLQVCPTCLLKPDCTKLDELKMGKRCEECEIIDNLANDLRSLNWQ